MREDLVLTVYDRDGQRHDLPALSGWQAMEIIRDYGLPIRAECGGACSCGTCHIYVDPTWLDKLYPPHEEEQDMLEDHVPEPEDNSRLACQIIMSEDLNGLVVHLAPNYE